MIPVRRPRPIAATYVYIYEYKWLEDFEFNTGSMLFTERSTTVRMDTVLQSFYISRDSIALCGDQRKQKAFLMGNVAAAAPLSSSSS